MIPCKRPHVTIEAHQKLVGHGDHAAYATFHMVTCGVPGCGFAYDAAVVTDAAQQATWHRAAHRDAVPTTSIVRDVEWDVYCEPCGGHRRTFGTRTDAQAWLDHHLSVEHGLVVYR